MGGAPYDAIAEWYDAYVREGPLYSEVIVPAMLELAGDIEGAMVCDVACGQGLIARELARRGAQITGVDISERLLALARRYEQAEPLGIRYTIDDAQVGATLADASFDGVTCGMALMTFPDLAAAFRVVRRILKPGGWYVFAITHPCFQTPQSRWVTREGGAQVREVGDYFDERYWTSEGSAGVRGKVGEYHRTLATYLNALIAAGLTVERIAEPRATGTRAEQVPGNRSVPSLLLVRARAG